MKKKNLVIAVVVGGVGLALWLGFGGSNSSQKENAANIAQVEQGDLESVVTAQGTLEPKEYVDVGAQVSGKVEKLHVEIGDAVKAGELIAEIDPDVYKSQMQASEAELKVLEAQRAEQRSLIKQAEQKYNRNKKLIKDKAVSTELLQDSETDLEVAKAKMTSLNAQIEKAQSTLDASKTNLSYTKIFSPMNGTVVSQSVKEGQTINANQTAPVIVQVANLAVMSAKAQVAEADISKLSVGMPVYFTTLGSKERQWNGTVRQILPTPETVNDVILYNVLVDAANDDGSLMMTMTTQMFFVLGKAEAAPLVPVSALQKRVPDQDTEAGQAYEVRVPGKDGGQKKTIIVGLMNRSKAQVISGLAVGDKVIAAPAAAQGGGQKTPQRMPGMGRI